MCWSHLGDGDRWVLRNPERFVCPERGLNPTKTNGVDRAGKTLRGKRRTPWEDPVPTTPEVDPTADPN